MDVSEEIGNLKARLSAAEASLDHERTDRRDLVQVLREMTTSSGEQSKTTAVLAMRVEHLATTVAELAGRVKDMPVGAASTRTTTMAASGGGVAGGGLVVSVVALLKALGFM
jgi:hypothetical protein